MAIATSTALAIGGMAVSAAGAGMSFAQASKQNRLMSEAETKAAEALAAGKKELEKNYYAGLAIQKEPYELQREAMMGTAAQAVEAGQESERGAAATAGRIYEAAQQGQGDIRATMGQELMGLEKLTAQEESRLRDMNANLSLQEAQGYQQMAADAQEAAARSTQQGFGALQTGIQQGIQMKSLYPYKGEEKTTPTTATNNFVMQNRQNKPSYDPFGIGNLGNFNQGGMLSQPFYTYPSNQYSQNPLSPNQPPYNPLSPNLPPYNPNLYNPFNIGG